MSDDDMAEPGDTVDPQNPAPAGLARGRRFDMGAILTALVVLGFFVENGALMFLYKPWAHGLPQPSSGGEGVAHAAGPPLECATVETPEVVLKLEPFLVNLADKKPRYVKATLQIGFTDQKAIDDLNEKPAPLAATRQIVIDLLGSRMAEEIVSSEGKARLRQELATKIDEIGLPGKVKQVYITELLVQF